MIFSIHSSGKLWQTEIPKGTPLALALGCFDGVHIGHRAILKAISEKKDGNIPAVWTFSEPLTKPYIENIETRIRLCAGSGVKFAICESFERFREMSAGDFVKYLFELGVKVVACGKDYRFGHNREGDAAFMKAECEKYGIEARVVESVMTDIDGQTQKVSSTLIRSLINQGRMSEVTALLGRPFYVSGVIVGGNNLGRTIQVPTINQRFEPGRIVPRHGVYNSICSVEGMDYPSITNIGTRPTVMTGSHEENCETHIIGEKLELYGKIATVKLYEFVRDEQKYESLEQLREQIEKDIKSSVEFFDKARV
jgi:riboflavin kinase/FMN adenylyltransferase